MSAFSWLRNHRSLSWIKSHLFGKYLIVTNTVSCGALFGLGDTAVQHFEKMHNDKPHNYARTGRMMVIGMIIGPCDHIWYGFLDRILPLKSSAVVAKKILLDQIIAAPSFTSIFFIGMGTLEGRSLKNSWEELCSKFWAVYKADWVVWPAAQAINFMFLPPQLRVIYVGFVTLCWDSFLSYTKHKDLQQGRPIKSLPISSTTIHQSPEPVDNSVLPQEILPHHSYSLDMNLYNMGHK